MKIKVIHAPEHERYTDLLARAVQKTMEDESLLLNPTDHGCLNDVGFKMLLDRRLKPLLKSQVYSRSTPDGEIWQIFTDGTKRRLADRFGNRVSGERFSQ